MRDYHPSTAPTSADRVDVSVFGDSIVALLAWIAGCAERARQRRALAGLDVRLLRDIGLTRADAEKECAKGGWLR